MTQCAKQRFTCQSLRIKVCSTQRMLKIPGEYFTAAPSLEQISVLCPKDVIFLTIFLQFILLGSRSALFGVGMLNKDSNTSWGSCSSKHPCLLEWPSGVQPLELVLKWIKLKSFYDNFWMVKYSTDMRNKPMR